SIHCALALRIIRRGHQGVELCSRAGRGLAFARSRLLTAPLYAPREFRRLKGHFPNARWAEALALVRGVAHAYFALSRPGLGLSSVSLSRRSLPRRRRRRRSTAPGYWRSCRWRRVSLG